MYLCAASTPQHATHRASPSGVPIYGPPCHIRTSHRPISCGCQQCANSPSSVLAAAHVFGTALHTRVCQHGVRRVSTVLPKGGCHAMQIIKEVTNIVSPTLEWLLTENKWASHPPAHSAVTFMRFASWRTLCVCARVRDRTRVCGGVCACACACLYARKHARAYMRACACVVGKG